MIGLIAAKTRQSLIVAYILSGVICGSWGFAILKEVSLLQELSHIGIAILLFLAGLELEPKRFFKQLSGLTLITLGSCIANILIVLSCSTLLGYTLLEGVWIGTTLMFSSTLLFIKLIPKVTEDQKKINSFCLSILIIEDIIAIIILMLVALKNGSIEEGWWQWLTLPISGIAAVILAFSFERFILRPLILAIPDRFEETKLLTALSWCLSIALLFKYAGFSVEIGAFLAGIIFSQNPLKKKIEKHFTFLRDFFLILFFVTLGAEIDLYLSIQLLLPTALISSVIILSKPYVLKYFFSFAEKNPSRLREESIRLGQSSEFGLLISLLAHKNGMISLEVAKLIQLVVIFTLILSSARIFYTYPVTEK